MRRLTEIVALLARHDRRTEADTRTLGHQMRRLVDSEIVPPSDRLSAGRTSPGLFDQEATAELVLGAALMDAGLDLADCKRVLAAAKSRPAERKRKAGKPYPGNGISEAVAAVDRGETGWFLKIEIRRSMQGRSVNAWIEGPDAEAISPRAAAMLSAYHHAQDSRIVFSGSLDLSDRLAPFASENSAGDLS